MNLKQKLFVYVAMLVLAVITLGALAAINGPVSLVTYHGLDAMLPFWCQVLGGFAWAAAFVHGFIEIEIAPAESQDAYWGVIMVCEAIVALATVTPLTGSFVVCGVVAVVTVWLTNPVLRPVVESVVRTFKDLGAKPE